MDLKFKLISLLLVAMALTSVVAQAQIVYK